MRSSLEAVCGTIAALALLAIAGTANAEVSVERGRYLANGVGACGNCHTPRGGPMKGKAFAGGNSFGGDREPFLAYAQNITPHPTAGIGRWTDADIIKAIREGKRPDGSIIGPPMPIHFLRALSDDDVASIVAYIRSIPPVDNTVKKSVYRMKLPPSYGPPVSGVTAPPKSDKIAYGGYLASVGHCLECHTPMVRGRLDLATMAGAGGRTFAGPWGESVSANITPDPETGIGHWTDDQVKRAITKGVRADGTGLRPPMAFSSYNRMTAEDLDALVAYIRTLKPVRNEVR